MRRLAATAILAMLGWPMLAFAQDFWDARKLAHVTSLMQAYQHAWTAADTAYLFHDSRKDAPAVPVPKLIASYIDTSGGLPGGGTVTATVVADDGHRVGLFIAGQSVLIDGKDVTGTLGSKITYGSDSPIIDGATGSQIAIGTQASARGDTTTNFSVTVSLSISLSLSVAVNAYQYLMARRRDPPSSHYRAAKKSSKGAI